MHARTIRGFRFGSVLFLQLCCVVALCSAASDIPPLEELTAKQVSSTPNQYYGLSFEVSVPSKEVVLNLNNETTHVYRAVRVRDAVVVLGGIGSEADLITIFTGNQLRQCLELLCYNPSLSPDGLRVAFRRFFPRTTESSLVRDRVAVLDIAAVMRGAVPCITKRIFAPPDDLGVNVYPPNPKPGQRFFAPIIWSNDSRSFFFVQTVNENSYVVGRASNGDGGKWQVFLSQTQMSGGPTESSHLQVSAFHWDSAGSLVVETSERNSEDEAGTKVSTLFDPETLSPNSRGSYNTLYVDGDTLIYERRDGAKSVLVAVNGGPSSAILR